MARERCDGGWDEIVYEDGSEEQVWRCDVCDAEGPEECALLEPDDRYLDDPRRDLAEALNRGRAG